MKVRKIMTSKEMTKKYRERLNADPRKREGILRDTQRKLNRQQRIIQALTGSAVS